MGALRPTIGPLEVVVQRVPCQLPCCSPQVFPVGLPKEGVIERSWPERDQSLLGNALAQIRLWKLKKSKAPKKVEESLCSEIFFTPLSLPDYSEGFWILK